VTSRVGQELAEQLKGLLAWIACIADAQPVESYIECLRFAGFENDSVEPHHEAMIKMEDQIRAKMLGVEILVGVKQRMLPAVNLQKPKNR
jgi:hypothetical protein